MDIKNSKKGETMKTMKRCLAILFAAVITASLFAACGESSSTNSSSSTAAKSEAAATETKSEAAAQTGQDSQTANVSEGSTFTKKTAEGTLVIGYLDGHQGNFDMLSDANFCARGMVYDTVLTCDPETNEVKGLIADSWENIDDTHLKLTIDKNAKFSDGTSVTAEDVFYSLERVQSQQAESMQLAAWIDFDNCKIEDDNTLILATFDAFAPAQYFLCGQNWACVMPKEWAENASADDFWSAPVGSGPYEVVSNTDGQSIVLKYREDYWNAANITTDIPTIEIKFYTSNNTMMLDYENGDLDIVINADSTEYDRMQNGALTDTVCDLKWLNDAFHLVLPYNTEKLQDAKVREAICMAIDVETFDAIVWGGACRPATSVLSSTMTYYENQGEHVFDVDGARKLMEEAGYSESNKLELDIWGDTGDSSQRQLTTLQAMLAEIYIDATPHFVDVPEVIEHIITGTTDFLLPNASGIGTNHPYEVIMSTDPASNANPTEVIEDEEYVALAHEAATELDEEKEAEDYAKLQEWLVDNHYMLPLAETANIILYRPYVTSFITKGDQENMTLRYITME